MIPNWLRQWRQQAYGVRGKVRPVSQRCHPLRLEELESRTLPSFSFGASLTPGAGFERGVALADFNGDGINDLAAADYASNLATSSQISILIGNGNRTFKPAQNISVGGGFFGFGMAATLQWGTSTATAGPISWR